MLREINLKLLAGQEDHIALKGNYIRLKTAPYDLLIRDVTKNDGNSFVLSEGDSANFASDFERVSFKNIGSGDSFFTVVIGKDASVNSSKVGGSVNVINGEISRVKNEQCLIGIATNTASAGQMPNCQLYNPVGSGKNLILTKMTFFSGNDAAIGITEYNTALAALSVFSPKNKKIGAAVGVGQLRSESNAIGLGGVGGSFANLSYKTADSVIEFPFNEPILIGQGKGVNAYLTALASSLSVTYQWYEESI